MPQSLDLAAFVFGAVLILLSLVAGSFKLFGAEVQGKVGTFGRVIAFVLGLVLITSRLIPQSSGEAHARADGGSAPVKEAAVIAAPAPAAPADDDPAPDGPGAAIETPARELILGTWRAEYGVADNRLKTKIHYDRNGTFVGVLTVVTQGLTNQVATQGTWRVRPLESGRFQLTTRDKERSEPESYTFRVLDHDRFKNEDLGYVAHRIPGD